MGKTGGGAEWGAVIRLAGVLLSDGTKDTEQVRRMIEEFENRRIGSNCSITGRSGRGVDWD